MIKTNTDLVRMSDSAIVKQIGDYIKNARLQQNKTQAQLAKIAGLNRWTLSQIENGESITLSSLIMLLRALNSLHILEVFDVVDEISPLEYAKLKKQKKQRVRNDETNTPIKDDLGW